MTYLYRSTDGLMQTNDPDALQIWESHAARTASAQSRATAHLLALGVKMEHPDDGWVNREKNTITPCYPRFDLNPAVGDLIALGWPWTGYRIVRCIRIGETLLTRSPVYHFEDTGERVQVIS